MGGGRVSDLVDGLHRGIDGRVEPKSIVSSAYIVVDGFRYADERQVGLARELRGAVEGAIASDHDQAVNSAFEEVGGGFLSRLGFPEFRTAAGAENGSAQVDDSRDAAGIHVFHLVIDEASPPAVDPDDLDAVGKGRSYNGANAGVQARAVSSAGQQCYSFQVRGCSAAEVIIGWVHPGSGERHPGPVPAGKQEAEDQDSIGDVDSSIIVGVCRIFTGQYPAASKEIIQQEHGICQLDGSILV